MDWQTENILFKQGNDSKIRFSLEIASLLQILLSKFQNNLFIFCVKYNKNFEYEKYDE